MSRSKNKSRIYKDGMRVQTRDNFFYGSDYFDHRHPNERDLYRKTYIVDSNRNDELVLVKSTTHQNRTTPTIDSRYIYYKDNNGNPIKIDGIKFKLIRRQSLNKLDTINLKKNVFTNNRYSRRNRREVHRKVKNRR